MWLFTVIDRTGRNIRLSRERWAHIQEHEEIPEIQEVIDTLIYPTKIVEMLKLDRIFYYRYNKKEKRYVLVVVNFINLGGYVLTCHYTSKIK